MGWKDALVKACQRDNKPKPTSIEAGLSVQNVPHTYDSSEHDCALLLPQAFLVYFTRSFFKLLLYCDIQIMTIGSRISRHDLWLR